MSKAQMRAYLDTVPVPALDGRPWVEPPPLAEATVAIVTTAGFLASDDPAFGFHGDASFRLLDAADRRLRIGHWSPNFDRAGIAADLNVAYPIDRLAEMEHEGVVGRVAPRHVSFVGNQDDTMETIRLDTGPAAARELLADGVDVALLVPV